MTAQYWTITGYDMWRLEEKTVCDLTNMVTGEVVRCENIIDAKFKAVIMPKIKSRTVKSTKQKAQKEKAKKPKTVKALSGKAPKSGSKYKGVKAEGKKFSAQCWDGKNKKLKYLGMFESELLAAAVVQEELGNYGEAKRLRNEYQEGNCRPEVEDRPNLAQRPSEE